MLADPRKGLWVALAIVAAALAWLAALPFAGDAIFARLGMGMHPITFLAIFAALAGAAAAWVFARFARVRSDLLAGRDVIARWRVGESALAAAAPEALAADEADKRGALLMILAFMALIFGAFALADPQAAPFMLSIGAVVAAVVGLAFLLGRRAARDLWRWRGGEAIVGRRGLIFNGALHVWAVPLTRLVGAQVAGEPPALVVAYRYLGRAGAQTVTVTLPAPDAARQEAARAAAALSAQSRA